MTRPGIAPRPLTITMPGGTVPVGRLFATIRYSDITEMKRGMDVIALLHDRAEKYVPASGAAVFEVRQGRIVALSDRLGEHEKFIGMAADDFANQIVTMRKNVSKK